MWVAALVIYIYIVEGYRPVWLVAFAIHVVLGGRGGPGGGTGWCSEGVVGVGEVG